MNGTVCQDPRSSDQELKTRATNGERVHMVAERELLSDHGEDGGRRMYLRREEMGAGTAGARRWLVPTALVSNTMRREQRLHHEKGAEVAGSGGSRGRSSPTWRENDVAELVPFRRMWPEGEYGSSERKNWLPGNVAGLVPFRRMWPEGEYGSSERKTGVPGDELAFLATCDGAVALVSLFGLARACLFFGLAWTWFSFLVNAWSGRRSWIETVFLRPVRDRGLSWWRCISFMGRVSNRMRSRVGLRSNHHDDDCRSSFNSRD
ncbi:uncharacterized protein LOC119337060 isoform X2 [Triticum dicoccoides]|uniref:uncharacterized protein LOC119337060 isoform X2 n=1 Tax=Triticum dicoccoides TaxID=85692 RepID=UPI0018917599|nr:uncharacterized protein LOC119337060 isoform X2 [Triticum dicoccoides]XP_037465062.1 uncharacterized protein LOC119337060 isoform X2 [Triticum dicoccoides]